MHSLLATLIYTFCTFHFVQSIDNDIDSETRFAFTPSWVIDNMSEIINARIGERFESDEFYIANGTWQLVSFPNGNDEETAGSYMVFLTLLQMPQHWESVTVRFTISSPETFSRVTRVVTYDKPKGLGWWPNSLLLQDIIHQNIDSLRWMVHIQILRIIELATNDIVYQHRLIYKNKHNIEWKVDGEVLDSMKTASKGKSYEMFPVPYNNWNSTMWTLRVLPNGKYDGFIDVYLVLFALPINIWSIKVKYTLSCIETNISGTYISYFGYFNNYRGWDKKILSLDEFRKDINDTVTFVADIEILNYFGRDGYEVVSMAHIFQLKHENEELRRGIQAMEEKINVLLDRLETIQLITNTSMELCV